MKTYTNPIIVVLLVILLATFAVLPAPTFASSIGNHDVTFDGYLVSTSNPGQTTWFYTVTSNSAGSGSAISHVTFALGSCLTFVSAGTWSGNLPTPTLTQGDGDPEFGTDPTTGVTGVKFDEGFSSGETKRYYFTVSNAVGIGPITVALKAGNGFVTGNIGGPTCNPVDPPLTVGLASFAAICQTDVAVITWETVSEEDTSGFNIWRSDSAGAPDIQLNASMIPAHPGSTQGYDYSWTDSTAQSGQTYYYWLENVNLNGATGLNGPVEATCASPTAVTVNGLKASSSTGFTPIWWAPLFALVSGIALAILLSRRVKPG